MTYFKNESWKRLLNKFSKIKVTFHNTIILYTCNIYCEGFTICLPDQPTSNFHLVKPIVSGQLQRWNLHKSILIDSAEEGWTFII
jgi:hypothetical protein